jgi:Ca2+-binding EF-hand superfamily protein
MYGEYEPIVEKNYQIYEDSGKNSPKEEETPIIVENNLQFDEADLNKDGVVSEEELREWYENEGWKNSYDGKAYFLHPWFDWNKKERWVNDREAINYWLNHQGGNQNAVNEYQKVLKNNK